VRDTADLREPVSRARHLTSSRGIGVLERVGPNNSGQSRSLFVVRRQVKRKREVDAVGTFVPDQLLFNAAKLRRRILELGQGSECHRGADLSRGADLTKEKIWGFGDRFL